jgi:parallel beta-helix repeat protein
MVSNNIIDSMEDYGISIFFSDNNLVTGNHIIGTPTSVGIDLHVADNNIIEGNTILSNEFGINAQYDSHDNLIYNNYFDNIHNAQDNGVNNQWNVAPHFASGGNIIDGYFIGGNWWSDYPHWGLYDPNGIGIALHPTHRYTIPGHVGAQDAAPIPGFELLAALGALALAILLYKRKH